MAFRNRGAHAAPTSGFMDKTVCVIRVKDHRARRDFKAPQSSVERGYPADRRLS